MDYVASVNTSRIVSAKKRKGMDDEDDKCPL